MQIACKIIPWTEVVLMGREALVSQEFWGQSKPGVVQTDGVEK